CAESSIVEIRYLPWRAALTVDLAEHDVLGADDGDGIGEHVAARHDVERLQVGKARSADLHAIRLVAAVGNHVDAEFALGVLDPRINLAGRDVHAFGEQLEVVDEVFHTRLHAFARRRSDLVVVDDDGAGVVAQPLDALADDAIAFTHFGHTAQIAVVAVAVHAHGHVELHAVVDFVGLVLAKIPFNAGTTQHGAGKTHGLCRFRRDHTHIDQTLLPDAVVGEQGFVLVDTGGEAIGEVFDEVEQRTRTRLVHGAQFFLAAVLAVSGVLRHGVGQVAVHTARAIVGRVHARARHRLVHVHEVFTFAEGIQEHGHGTHVERVGTERHQVVQNARDLVEHHPDILGAQRDLDTQQLLDGHDIGVLIAHHRHVVETIHVWQRLQIGAMFGQLLGGAVQQPDMWVGTLDHFTVEFEHQTQNAVGRRVLGTKVQGVI